MTYLVNPKNKKEEKLLETVLERLSIDYYTEEAEEKALINAMKIGRKTKLLNSEEKANFLIKLKSTK